MSAFQGQKLVHFDLKGAPPKLEYMLRLIPLLREWGATGILMEYEDFFPYKDQFQVVRKPRAYTLNDIHRLQQAAENENLTFIPLVQTFGHMEFVLKHAKFADVLETANNPISVCPLHKAALNLVKSLVDQVVEAHEDLKYLHIGGDEVFNLGTCAACQASSMSKQQLYSTHMIPLLQYVKTKWPSISLLIWHDMLADYSVEELQPFGSLVEPMAWGYLDDIGNYFPQEMFSRFSQVFDNIWVASSYKGSSGPTADFVPLEHHVANHLSWLQLISNLPETTRCKISGIALTGWSRYDHFATLCELFAPAVPSLVLCLAILENGHLTNEVEELVAQQLGFTSTRSLKPLVSDPNAEFEKGCFPGSELFSYVAYLEKAKFFLKRTRFQMNGWITNWHWKNKLVNAAHLEHARWLCDVALKDLSFIRVHVGQCLRAIYHEETVEEWLEVKVEERIRKGNGYLEILNNFNRKRT
ncbi:hexosaminidase D-like [Dendronephthya gigantea]|uniref:hexosaminidase D-like n=1 Tax=Dendronephthya gigantea TaxID=151771 RepID=UPI00106A8F17|nr:hexosaminidase D-like [Dendronephthya gigantea]